MRNNSEPVESKLNNCSAILCKNHEIPGGVHPRSPIRVKDTSDAGRGSR